MSFQSKFPTPLSELSPELVISLKKRVEGNLSALVNKLSSTVFFKESPALHALRRASRNTLADSNSELPSQFYASVPFTTYDDYSTYVDRFLDNEVCRKADVEDLLSPGLPLFLARTSGTSGSAPKYFPKYYDPSSSSKSWDSPDAPQITICGFNSIRVAKIIQVVDAAGKVVHAIPDTIISSGSLRHYYGIGPGDDQKIITQKANFSPSPFAVWLLPAYQSNIYLHAFFAVIDPSIVFMHATLSTILFDAVRVMERNWEAMVLAIELGTLPDAGDIGEYGRHLEPFLKPNPLRAAELREIEHGSLGWLKKVWPSLVSVVATLSGQYENLHTELRHHFGPTVILRSVTFSATESVVGVGYDPSDINLYKLDSNVHIELLDVEMNRSPDNISQLWEVKTGKKYEVFVTTNDGLWRYALGDIIEAAGFNPTDGQPLVRYCERRGVGFRVAGEFISESYLRAVIKAVSEILGMVVEFTAEIDSRSGKGLGAYGFFVELASALGPDAQKALTKIHERLLLNPGYKTYHDSGLIAKPTLRIVTPGTFQAFREWKVQRGSPISQIKVPTTIIDLETRQWMAKRVFLEIDDHMV